MIKKVVLRFRKTSVYSSGNYYDSYIDKPDGYVFFSRNYARNTPTKEVWEDLREACSGWFIQSFWLGAVFATKPPASPTGDADADILQQSKHIQRKVFSKDRLKYDYNQKLTKWHITRDGYIQSLEESGSNLEMGVSDDAFGYVHSEDEAIAVLDRIQEEMKGKTIKILLFIYPDRYDDEIRMIFELEIEFWD